MRFTPIASLLLAFSIGCSMPKGILDTADDNYTEGSVAGDCADEIDNDNDGLTDCEDDGCFGVDDCAEGGNSDGSTDDGADSTSDGTAGGETTSGATTDGGTTGTDGDEMDSGRVDTGLDGVTDSGSSTGGETTGDDGACAADEVLSCYEFCTLAEWVGDGTCDSWLDCDATRFDGGDCIEADDATDVGTSSGCAVGEIESCYGTCTSAAWVGDGECDSWLNCEETDYDGGDCGTPEESYDATPTACEEGEILSCYDFCTDRDWLGDGACDSWLNCAEKDFDDGDCTTEDADDLTDDSVCDEGEVLSCYGSCTSEAWVGDGECDSWLDCAETEFDGGDCGTTADEDDEPSAICGDGEILSCYDFCTDEDWLGDGSCDSWLNCEEKDFDGGDCSDTTDEPLVEDACDDGEVLGCYGVCTSATWVGDGECDSWLDCEETAYDGGDCGTTEDEDDEPSASCGDGEILSCYDFCTDEAWVGDGACDSWLDCPETDYDGGDCSTTSDDITDIDAGTCGEGEVLGCYGVCTSAIWVGDGECDSWLDCEETAYDGGDCSGSVEELDADGCEPDEVMGCTGFCTSASWVGDDTCDSWLNCEAHDFDGGDCEAGGDVDDADADDDSIECGEGEVASCSGYTCWSVDIIGDDNCDWYLDCDVHGFDGGDCSGEDS